jgi:hypothetical protein
MSGYMGGVVDWGVLWRLYAEAGAAAATVGLGGVIGWCYIRVTRIGRQERNR